MKEKKIEIRELSKEFRVNRSLDNKYSNQPLFKDKVERANDILKTIKLPKI